MSPSSVAGAAAFVGTLGGWQPQTGRVAWGKEIPQNGLVQNWCKNILYYVLYLSYDPLKVFVAQLQHGMVIESYPYSGVPTTRIAIRIKPSMKGVQTTVQVYCT